MCEQRRADPHPMMGKDKRAMTYFAFLSPSPHRGASLVTVGCLVAPDGTPQSDPRQHLASQSLNKTSSSSRCPRLNPSPKAETHHKGRAESHTPL